jgi:large conductance mechanosensitive channel
MLEEFKKFILKGNVLDLAAAVVIGIAFKAVIDALVNYLLMPIVGIIGGKPTFDEYFVTINDSQIRWGSFLTEVVSFLIVAAALFAVIKSFEKLQTLRKATVVDEPEAPLTASEQLLAEIRDLLVAQGGTGGTVPPV